MDDELGQLARRQWGVFSRAQALEAGMSKAAVGRRLARGTWLRFDTGVYRFPGGQDSWHQKVMAATLALGPNGMASHRTAAWLWDLDLRGGAPILLEVLAPKSAGQRTTRAKVHRTRRVPAPVFRSGIRTTPLARTLLDLAETVDDRDLHRAVDPARRKHGDVFPALERELFVNATGRRRGPERVTQLLIHVKQFRHTDSPLEADAARELQRTPMLARAAHQHVICAPNGRFIARVDFAWLLERVVVMCDSHQWHLSREAWEHDLEQRRQLESHGWRVFPLTRRMLDHSPWLDDLARLLAAQSAGLHASP